MWPWIVSTKFCSGLITCGKSLTDISRLLDKPRMPSFSTMEDESHSISCIFWPWFQLIEVSITSLTAISSRSSLSPLPGLATWTLWASFGLGRNEIRNNSGTITWRKHVQVWNAQLVSLRDYEGWDIWLFGSLHRDILPLSLNILHLCIFKVWKPPQGLIVVYQYIWVGIQQVCLQIILRTFKQGDDVDDLAATVYKNVNLTRHPDKWLWSILGLPHMPFPLVKKNWHRGAGGRQRKHGSLVWSTFGSNRMWVPMCSRMRWPRDRSSMILGLHSGQVEYLASQYQQFLLSLHTRNMLSLSQFCQEWTSRIRIVECYLIPCSTETLG